MRDLFHNELKPSEAEYSSFASVWLWGKSFMSEYREPSLNRHITNPYKYVNALCYVESFSELFYLLYVKQSWQNKMILCIIPSSVWIIVYYENLRTSATIQFDFMIFCISLNNK